MGSIRLCSAVRKKSAWTWNVWLSYFFRFSLSWVSSLVEGSSFWVITEGCLSGQRLWWEETDVVEERRAIVIAWDAEFFLADIWLCFAEQFFQKSEYWRERERTHLKSRLVLEITCYDWARAANFFSFRLHFFVWNKEKYCKGNFSVPHECGFDARSGVESANGRGWLWIAK